jgi:hypothetical protein
VNPKARFVIRVRPRSGGAWVHSELLPWELARKVADKLRVGGLYEVEVVPTAALKKRISA